METIRFSTIYCSSAVISMNYLNLCGSFTSDMLPRLCWTVPGLLPLFRTAASRWILTGAERSLIFSLVWHIHFDRTSGSRGGRTEVVQCRYRKGKPQEQPWKWKYLLYCAYTELNCLPDAAYTLISRWFPGFFLSLSLSRSLKASSIRTNDATILLWVFNSRRLFALICMKKADLTNCFSSFLGKTICVDIFFLIEIIIMLNKTLILLSIISVRIYI